MMRVKAAAAIGAFLLAGTLAPAAPAPLTPAQVDQKILAACADKGGKPAECACGLKIAHEEMTPRQLALVPVLLPIVKGKGDTMTKVSAGLAAAQDAGYTQQEALALVFAVQNQASRTEHECKAPG
jgi:hypothetical protein